jgi:hypothetical protein
MEFDPWTARCEDCDFERQMPSRDHAAHAKRVHEDETGHTVFLVDDE